MHRFLFHSAPAIGDTVALEPEQSKHLAKVLRLEVETVVGIIDGKGTLAKGAITAVHAKASQVRILEVQTATERSRVRLCFAAPKGQALDFIFRRAPELGIEGLQPLQTRFSTPTKGWNAERWDTVVGEVCKQCEELFFPQVFAPLSLDAFLRQRDPKRVLVLCDENARSAEAALPQGLDVDLVVGAEGGFHASEVESLHSAGALSLGLGRNRLRAETAALVALTLTKKTLGEL